MAYSSGAVNLNAVVVNIGSDTCRIGFAGEEQPKVVLPSAYLVEVNGDDAGDVEMGASAAVAPELPQASGAAAAAGSQPRERGAAGDTFKPLFDLDRQRPGVGVRYPLEDGLVTDWAGVEALIEHGLRDKLGSDPSQHPFVLAEPVLAPRSDRAKWGEMVFEHFGSPGLFVGREPVLACFAHARTSGMVVDVGRLAATVTPVQEGYALMMGVRRNLVAGDTFDEQFMAQVKRQGSAPHIRPGFCVRRVPARAANRPPTTKEVDVSNLDPTFMEFHSRCVLRAAREQTCRLSEARFDYSAHEMMPNVPYELPDGSTLQVGAQRLQIPELLMEPGPVKASIPSALPLPRVILDSAMSCDAEVRRDLTANMLLTGGLSGMPGFMERLFAELEPIAPAGTRIRFLPSVVEERSVAAWIGGSILGSMGDFPDMFVSKAEYEEHGPQALVRKCP